MEFLRPSFSVGRDVRKSFEGAFGIAGVFVAPIIYAYLKAELADRKLI
ncbi:MAG TPA: hypothetical protein VF579_08510 [Candidatus Methylomirabilis sp.]